MQCLRLVDDRHRNIGIAPFPQNLVVKDELELVLNHAYGHSELHRTASLALRHPAGVFLENRKHLLIVRDRLALQKTPLDLVHLPTRMGNQSLNGGGLRNTCGLQLLATVLGSTDQVTATFEIGFDSVRPALRASRRADLVETPLHLCVRCRHWRQPARWCFLAARPSSRSKHRIASHSRLTSVG